MCDADVFLGLSRISNFDDLDPLLNDPNLQLTVLQPGQTLPTDTILVIIPGSKSTRGDLKFLKEQGWNAPEAGGNGLEGSSKSHDP